MQEGVEVTPVSARTAAVAFDVCPRTVRRWCKRGAPAVGHSPLRVDVAALRRWRAGNDSPERTAEALLDVLRCEAMDGRPAHELLGIRAPVAAAYLCQAFDRLHPDVTAYPEAVLQLRRIAGADA